MRGRALALVMIECLIGACTVATLGGPKCSGAYANRAIAFVCR